MKITFLSPAPNLSGGQRVIAIYAERLQARGHDVTVVARKATPPGRRQRLKALLKLRAPRRMPVKTHYDPAKVNLKLVERAGPITAEDLPDADVIIATWWETAFMVADLPPEKGRKFYFVQHHEVHQASTRHLSAGSYRLPLRKITIAGWLVEEMARRYDDHDVILVPNSVDHALFHAAERGKQPHPTVGLMYSHTPFKGLDVALAALRDVEKTCPDLKVIAFGATPPNSALPLPGHAEYHLQPPQDALRRLYARCDAFLFASRNEGFGLPVLEAMACRTPVVGTRAGCAPDVIVNGQNGYLADIDDAGGLAAGLVKVLTASEADWKSLSARAHEASAGYSWDDATTLFEKALISG